MNTTPAVANYYEDLVHDAPSLLHGQNISTKLNPTLVGRLALRNPNANMLNRLFATLTDYDKGTYIENYDRG